MCVTSSPLWLESKQTTPGVVVKVRSHALPAYRRALSSFPDTKPKLYRVTSASSLTTYLTSVAHSKPHTAKYSHLSRCFSSPDKSTQSLTAYLLVPTVATKGLDYVWSRVFVCGEGVSPNRTG